MPSTGSSGGLTIENSTPLPPTTQVPDEPFRLYSSIPLRNRRQLPRPGTFDDLGFASYEFFITWPADRNAFNGPPPVSVFDVMPWSNRFSVDQTSAPSVRPEEPGHSVWQRLGEYTVSTARSPSENRRHAGAKSIRRTRSGSFGKNPHHHRRYTETGESCSKPTPLDGQPSRLPNTRVRAASSKKPVPIPMGDGPQSATNHPFRFMDWGNSVKQKPESSVAEGGQ